MFTRIVAVMAICSIVSLSLARTENPGPEALSGTYVFDGHLQSPLRLEVETVYTLAESGKHRLEELKGQGYTCTPRIRSWYRCDRLSADAGLPEDIAKPLAEQYAGATLEFLPEEGGRELLYESEVSQQWAIYNPVVFQGQRFEQYWVLVTQDIVKVTLGKPDTDVYHSFVLRPEGRLDFTTQVKKGHDSGWTSYLAFVGFEKVDGQDKRR